MAKRLVGKATAKLISHPLANLLRNPAVHPVFTRVIVEVIVVFKASVINNAIDNLEYFLLNFKAVNHPSSFPATFL
jgi:ketopantoate reductase